MKIDERSGYKFYPINLRSQSTAFVNLNWTSKINDEELEDIIFY